MTGKELLIKVVLSLYSYLNIDDQELFDLLDIDSNLEDGLSRLISHSMPDSLGVFVRSLKSLVARNSSEFLATPYSLTGSKSVIDFTTPELKNKNRAFAFSNSDFNFVSTSALFSNTGLIDLADNENSLIWKQLESYIERCYSSEDQSSITSFFDIIKNIDKDKGLLVTRYSGEFNAEKSYSYIYLAFLNESKSIVVSQELRYTPSTIFSPLSYDNTKTYEQFFDIYDVLNDLNQTTDILNRFLRLFHIFEYLVYRVYLAKLVTRLGNSKIFVREFINSSESMKKGEKESFIKNFGMIFTADIFSASPIVIDIASAVDSGVKDFLKEKKIVSSFEADKSKKIAELVYGLRCCIVHNKESEYHMTISNYEDYSVIIPLIKKVLENFEKLVIKKILLNDPIISYSRERIRLY